MNIFSKITVSKALEFLNAKISLRNCTSVGRYPRVSGKVFIRNGGRMILGPRVKIRGEHVPVELATYPGATMTIGENTHINSGTSICAQTSVTIGKNVGIGNYNLIMDTDFHQVGDFNGAPVTKPIVIEDDVWLGGHVTIMKGVTIGSGAVVSAGAVVATDIAPHTLVGGNPARFIRKIEPRAPQVTAPEVPMGTGEISSVPA